MSGLLVSPRRARKGRRRFSGHGNWKTEPQPQNAPQVPGPAPKQAPVPSSVLQHPPPKLQPAPFGAHAHRPPRQMPLQHCSFSVHTPDWMQEQNRWLLASGFGGPHVPEQQSVSAVHAPLQSTVPCGQHRSPQSVVPAGQGMQFPPTHEVPAAQTVPQPPQFPTSVERSTHAPLQQEGQSPLQALVQLPQVLLAERLVHWPLQQPRPGRHCASAVQQAVDPRWPGSAHTFVVPQVQNRPSQHCPLVQVCPFVRQGGGVGDWQTPAWQVWSAVQQDCVLPLPQRLSLGQGAAPARPPARAAATPPARAPSTRRREGRWARDRVNESNRLPSMHGSPLGRTRNDRAPPTWWGRRSWVPA
jgi:hypothetical protein